MNTRTDILLIIDPSSTFSVKAAVKTLESVAAHFSGDPADIQYYVMPRAGSDSDGSKVFKQICKKTNDRIQPVLTDIDDLQASLKGDYVFILEQGALIKTGDVAKITEIAQENEYNVVEPLKTSEEKLPISGYISIYSNYLLIGEERTNILVKRAAVHDISSILREGIEAEKAFTELLLDSEGSYYYIEMYIDFGRPETPVEITDADSYIDDLANYSLKRLGYVCEYIQDRIVKILSQQMGEHSNVKDPQRLLQPVTDVVICKNIELDVDKKIYLLSKKYGRDIRRELYVTDLGRLYFGDNDIDSINSAAHLKICISTIRDDILTVEGMTDIPFLLSSRYAFRASAEDNKLIPIELKPLTINDGIGFEGEYYFKGEQFRIELPLKKAKKFSIYLEDENGHVITLSPRMGDYSRLNSKIPVSYFSMNGYLVKCTQGILSVVPYSKKLHRKYELGYLKSLLLKGKITSVMYRLLYYIDKRFQKKPVWLVMDRPHLAKDNGEHMFRFLQTTDAAKKNDIYFVLKKNSRDYERMKKVGKVLKHNSLRHRLKFMEAQVLIAAAANNMTVNAFGRSGAYYRDLYNFDFVYLRHGVSHNDQSEWLHKLKKNIRILVATCRPEYEGILQGDYGYTEREVKLTGLSRYDNLYDEREKKIAILPTWRKNLEGDLKYRSSERDYISGFKDTDYFRFYNSLINDERLLSVMKEYGYTGVFYLHPVFAAQFGDFKGNDIISVGKGVADYQKVFKESSLMVTDFSSVAFDFAYLKKPVIYSQFDEDTFYKYHTWGKGYFTYREDGFGPITNTLDETVETLIDYIKNGCIMKDEYVKKVDNFFAYTDRNNRERIYKEIVKAEEEK